MSVYAKMQQDAEAQAARLIKAFNKACPVGTEVMVHMPGTMTYEARCFTAEVTEPARCHGLWPAVTLDGIPRGLSDVGPVDGSDPYAAPWAPQNA